MKPWDFKVDTADSLLVWADLWEDHGVSECAHALRVLHGRGRWPGKQGKNTYVWRVRDDLTKDGASYIFAADFRIPHNYVGTRVRTYPTVTAAFFDLLMCRLTGIKEF